ncbi:TetR/AcrR family transcriptional regulator [Pseudonocardia acidicola]|uniref:TetR/AcrR family transcriptional regulator n=1 Tax=Pseudonocardia acidicola TaxID=2724939 RepID=A0ABX1S9F5_9PSEU|nr:TetR/AcrR family transcriptional regulator [Pseudonocardia acidicola]NMH98199.1 TetR/AcrR family transcriptional regulator [Pseudonocardia acidicola]
MRSPSGRGAHRPSRRESVLAAGLAEFTQRGYSATAMGSIAERAGMSTSSIYYHFPSKDTILLELLNRAATSLRETVAAVDPGVNRTDTARRTAAAYVGWLMPDPRRALLLLGNGVGGTATVEADRRAHDVALTRAVADLLRRATPTDVDLLVAATALVVLFGELARTQVDDPVPEPRLRAVAERLAARLVP